MHIAIVVGTRPESIKLAPIAQALGPEAFAIHTGQHHTAGMTGHLRPDLVLDTHPHTPRGQQLGSTTAALDHAFRQHRPDAVIVQGDTTSALAGALAANTTDTPLIHVEAGLRSFDRTMPEEHNRVLVDHLCDLACAPTPQAHDNLRAENIPPDRIALTGNTIVEAVASELPDVAQQTVVRTQLGIATEPFVLATFHRPENTDNPTAIRTILNELAAVTAPVVLPLHPRSQHQLHNSGHFTPAPNLRMTGPLDYPALLALIQNAALLISDSGGIQEEASILKRPILIIRRSNERPEIEGTFGIRLKPGKQISCITNTYLNNVATIQSQLTTVLSPYGDGTASTQIVDATKALLSRPETLHTRTAVGSGPA